MFPPTRMTAGLILAFAAMLLLACGGPDAEQSASVERTPPLRFSAIPDQDETRLRERFEPVARYLAAQLGVPVEYVHATRYADAVELFKNGDVSLAWFGGLTGVQARHAVAGARAIAQGVEDPDFYSYFIAHRDTGLARSDVFPAAIAGLRFAFGSPGSTSGRLMPEHFIRENTSESPEALFAALSYSGSHDRTAELVASGQFDVGAINYKVYDRRVAEGQTDPEEVRAIWQTPPYPDYNFTAHPALDAAYGAGFTDRLQQVLVDMDDPQLLGAFSRKGLIAARNRDFDSIRALAFELGFIR
jgi:phosphonate transport system substrate-binding protein